jgi:hypothetical protein
MTNQVLSKSQIDSLSIDNLCIHMIEKDSMEFKEGVNCDVTEYSDYFKKIVQRSLKGAWWNFSGESSKNLWQQRIEQMTATAQDFWDLSITLGNKFKEFHDTSRLTVGGNFIVGHLSVDDIDNESTTHDILCILKIDLHKVVGLKEENDQVEIEELLNAISQDPQKVQKFALVNFSNAFPWDVIAFDRSSKVSTSLTKYFQDFLDVTLADTDSILSKKLFEHTLYFCEQNELSVVDAHGLIIQYLDNPQPFNFETFFNSVFDSTDTDLKEKFRNSLNNAKLLRDFQTDSSDISKTKRSSKIICNHGVNITWVGGTMNNRNITTSLLDDGRTEIRIVTSSYDEK